MRLACMAAATTVPGSWREMGMQYDRLPKELLTDFHGEIDADLPRRSVDEAGTVP